MRMNITFDLQFFGTNDTVRASHELKIGFNTDRNTIEYITLQNPKRNLTETSVRSAAQYLLDNSIFFDKESQSYTSVATAYTEEKSTTTLDLT